MGNVLMFIGAVLIVLAIILTVLYRMRPPVYVPPVRNNAQTIYAASDSAAVPVSYNEDKTAVTQKINDKDGYETSSTRKLKQPSDNTTATRMLDETDKTGTMRTRLLDSGDEIKTSETRPKKKNDQTATSATRLLKNDTDNDRTRKL